MTEWWRATAASCRAWRVVPVRRFVYLVSMTARVDQNGEKLHQIHTDPRAPEAKYLVRVKKDVQYPFHLAEPPAPGG